MPGIVPQEKLDELRVGVKLEDGMTAPAIVNLTSYDYEKNLTHFTVTIHEGRNRQVRRMCDHIGFPVRYLRRVKMGILTLNGLRKGDCRELFDEEVEALRLDCGLESRTEKKKKPVDRKAVELADGKKAKKPDIKKAVNKEANIKKPAAGKSGTRKSSPKPAGNNRAEGKKSAVKK